MFLTVTLPVIGTMVALIGILGAFLFKAIERLDSDIKKLNGRLESKTARIDRLYQMFCDLLSKKQDM